MRALCRYHGAGRNGAIGRSVRPCEKYYDKPGNGRGRIELLITAASRRLLGQSIHRERQAPRTCRDRRVSRACISTALAPICSTERISMRSPVPVQ